MFSAEGVKALIDMLAEEYGTIGRWMKHVTIWAVVIAIFLAALGGISYFLEYLTRVFVGQGLLFILFMFIGFGIIGAVGGLVHFVLEKGLEKFKARKE